MSTTSVEQWGNLDNLGPIYPFVGTEMFWTILVFAGFILWFVWQARFEARTHRNGTKRLSDPKVLEKVLSENITPLGHPATSLNQVQNNNHEAPAKEKEKPEETSSQ
ncbi:hypothetical protein [Thiohalorhabdus methylotrophus]|uniref:Uncharacterized protein n=1 Tax=Thiohalorhabdus methylotrophus TaxID=3242694 RepID=A0ABV4TSX7_9GAMM